VGGWLFSRFVHRADAASMPDAACRRFRFVSPLILVASIAIPAVATEGYLRSVIDPRLTRYAVGSAAVVDLHGNRASLPLSSPWLALVGARVRVDRDAAPHEIELFASSGNGLDVKRIRDRRNVAVTILDGDRRGEAISFPHCYLRPVR
jgi:hypothetical protein